MRTRAVVVDANIARSAGVGKDFAVPCLETLAAIRAAGYSASFCQELLDEWTEHQSSLASEWLAEMFKSKRIRRVSLTSGDFSSLRRRFPPEARTAKGFEDIHLILTAQRASKVILSNDERARKLFANKSPKQIKSTIRWSNPCLEERTLEWIESGLTGRPDLLLSRYSY